VWSVAATRDAVREAAGPLPPPATRAFCEDTSKFVDYEQAVEYESDLPGSYDQRFVARLHDVAYRPFSRLVKAR